MRRQSTIALLFTLVIIGAVSIALVPGTSLSQNAERPTDPQPPQPPTNVTSTLSEDSVEPHQYRVIAESEAAINRSALEVHGEVGTQAGPAIELKTTPAGAATVANLSWVDEVRRATQVQTNAVAGGGSADNLGVEKLHNRGITGDNVSVGIVTGGIDEGAPSIADNVASYRSFASGTETHGTGVAMSVLKTAPETTLHLTSVATTTDYEAAIAHLRSKNVDIIVASISQPHRYDAGNGPLADDIQTARNDEILYVNSAGNYAMQHWQGDFTDTDGDSLHEFSQNTETNCIPTCANTYTGSVRISLHWPNEGDGSQYRLLLYNPETEQFVADSTPRVGSETANLEILSGTFTGEPLDLAVQHLNGPADDELEVRITGAPRFNSYVQESSLASPADVPGVVAVGAFEREPAAMASYSSQGPTADGRRGVTVTGYTNIALAGQQYGGVFTGTSAAAPHVAGVAALVEGATTEDLSEAELKTRLTESADDIETPGSDTISGTGVINATAAVPESTDDDSGTLSITADQATAETSPSNSVTITYTVKNPRSQPTSVLVEYPGLPANITLQGVGGDIAQNLSGSTPPGLITTDVPAKSNTTVTATFAVSNDAAPEVYGVDAQATIETTDGTASATATTNISVSEESSLVARFGGSDNEIGNLDVLRAVNAANNDQEIGGKPVSNLDVLQLVNRVT